MRRVLLYAHDTVGLGHVRRVSRIADGIARHDGETTTLVLSGSSVADALPFPANADVVKLPSLRKIRNGDYGARNLEVTPGSVLAMRTGMITEAFRHFRPDVVVVDKVPSGVDGELLPGLRWLKRHHPGARVFLSLRDILDDPIEVRREWKRDGSIAAIRELYDSVLVWGMQEVCDVAAEYSLPDDVKAMVRYCGYLGPEGSEAPHRTPGERSKRLVVATVGGGEDGERVLTEFVRSLDHVEESFASVMVLGPDLPPERRDAIRRLVAGSSRPVFAVDFTRHLERLLDACDLVVCMGGYNTVTEVVSRGRRAVVIPRIHPRREQLIRARRLERLGHVRMVHPDDLTPETLAAAIDAELSSGPATAPRPLDFRGLERAMRTLLGPIPAVLRPALGAREAAS